MTTRPSIHVQGLSRSFGTKDALRDVSMTVNPGEIRALLGPNGAGKTTLIRVIVGSVKPTSGDVSVMGVPWSDLSRRRSRTLFGLVSSGDRSSYYRLSGMENLVFFGRLYGLPRSKAKQRASEVLQLVGLADAASVHTGDYSHGMQKRLTIARALIMQPPVLLVDEATHDLDPAGARLVRDILKRAAGKGAAVLWATQRVDEIADTAASVTVLDRGTVRFDGTVEDLASSYDANRYRIELANPHSTESHVDGLAGQLVPIMEPHIYSLTLPADMTLARAISTLSEEGLEVVGCRSERSELEEAFLALTGEEGQ